MVIEEIKHHYVKVRKLLWSLMKFNTITLRLLLQSSLVLACGCSVPNYDREEDGPNNGSLEVYQQLP